MKITKIKEELKNLSANDLSDKLDNLRRELFGLTLNAQVKDVSQFNKLKKNIARAQTYLRQQELAK